MEEAPRLFSCSNISLAEEIITVRIMEIPVMTSLEIPFKGRDWRNVLRLDDSTIF
jgi:hypothetical protein